MRKELTDEQVRVTARLPKPLYDALCAQIRTRYRWHNDGRISLFIRYALQHYLTCPTLIAAKDEDEAYQAWLDACPPPKDLREVLSDALRAVPRHREQKAEGDTV
jgi:hypothetical protein